MIISYSFVTFVPGPAVAEPAVGQLSAKKSTRSKGKTMRHNLLMTIATDFEPATSSGDIETNIPKSKTRTSNRSKGYMIIVDTLVSTIGLPPLQNGCHFSPLILHLE